MNVLNWSGSSAVGDNGKCGCCVPISLRALQKLYDSNELEVWLAAGINLWSASFSLPRAFLQSAPSWHHFILVPNFHVAFATMFLSVPLYTFLSEKNIGVMKLCALYTLLFTGCIMTSSRSFIIRFVTSLHSNAETPNYLSCLECDDCIALVVELIDLSMATTSIWVRKSKIRKF